MNKNIITGIVIVLALVLVFFMYRNSNTANHILPVNIDQQTKTPTSTVTDVSVASVHEFVVNGGNYFFTPSMMEVKKGDTVKVIFKNSGGMHDFRIDEFGVATKVITSGAEETIEFVADKAGSFEYYCSVGKHRQMGMKGTLVVTE